MRCIEIECQAVGGRIGARRVSETFSRRDVESCIDSEDSAILSLRKGRWGLRQEGRKRGSSAGLQAGCWTSETKSSRAV